MTTIDPAATASKIIDWLTAWLDAAEQHWHADPNHDQRGWYGSGFNNWGVQTNQKYVAAAATVAARTTDVDIRARAAERAVAALRFSLASHLSGDGRCADGQQWGHTWISALGIERMMFAIDLLDPWLTDADRAAVDAMLISECRWIHDDLQRGEARGIVADRWNSSGRNVPESNLWNGALLWRTAQRRPELAEAASWKEQAIRFLINSVSTSADADDHRVVDGAPIRDRHVGANFFDGYALDHHGYLNVGYMVICLSNAAYLHFDLQRRGEPAPQALHHHQDDLWRVVRTMIGTDGRMLRIGGDSRVRYAYCQEYLLPALLYAADQHHDQHALPLAAAQLELIRTEQQAGADGSFYGTRLAELKRRSPYYWTRLESDRAACLAFAAAHLEQIRLDPRSTRSKPGAATSEFEASVAGGWVDHDHAAVLHRGPKRFASFAWRANGLSQGLCLPPDRSDLAEWDLNLAPEIVVEGAPRTPSKIGIPVSRHLQQAAVEEFDGGFLTWGRVAEGADMTIAEGWSGGPAALSDIVVAALPDQQTMIGIHRVRTVDHFAGIISAKGLHLSVPNDVLNGSARELDAETWAGRLIAGESGNQRLGRWANVDDQLGVVALSDDKLLLDRSAHRRGGPLGSIFTEELCLGWLPDPGYLPPHSTVLSCGWAVLSGATSAVTREFAATNSGASHRQHAELHQLHLSTPAGTFLLLANLGPTAVTARVPFAARDEVTGTRHRDHVELDPGRCLLLRQQPPATVG